MRNNRRKGRAGRGTQPRTDTPTATTISALIEKPNIWSDWLANCSIGPLSWVQMAALLMRDTQPETIVDRVAPMLERIRQGIEDRIREWAQDAPDEPEVLITFGGYRELFLDELYENYCDFLKTLGGNVDLEWLRDRLIASGAGVESLVWFLLNGIAYAQLEGQLDGDRVAEDARWLAELDFYEPAHTPGDEVVLRELYENFRETFARAAPAPDDLFASPFHESPIDDTEDPYIERLAVIEKRQPRHAPREYVPTSDTDDLPQDAWRRAMRANAWSRALDLAKVPGPGWQRQIAFLLRDVSLDEVALRTERTLLDMADITDRNAIEDAAAREHEPKAIKFGLWYKWWREHFRHWNDPLRSELEGLCRSEDAGLIADWLPRLDGAVFANFLITCAQARVIDARLGFGPHDKRLLTSELFDFDTEMPLVTGGLHSVTLELWERFRKRNGVEDYDGDLALNFRIDGASPFAKDQPGSDVRL